MIGRYELKYVIEPHQRRRILDAAGTSLEADPHGDNAVYRVSSLYFDTHDFVAYWEKVDGESVRRKFRLRYYSLESKDEPDEEQHPIRVGAAFMEIKRRIQNTVFKNRIRLTGEGALAILSDSSELQFLHRHIDEDLPVIDRAAIMEIEKAATCDLLEPKAVITYLREAWLGTVDDRLRVTFDSRGQVYPAEAFDLVDRNLASYFLPPGKVIMEVKFNNAIPYWLRDILVEEGLVLQRFSKYAAGVEVPAQQYRREVLAGAGIE